ncbi:MAG: AAA family ATPase, partial [Brachymonas denitrificans]
FIRRELRDQFRVLAQQAGVPFGILAFEAPEAVLRQRIRQRQQQGDDASEADVQVLEGQLQALEPLAPDEEDHAVRVDSTVLADWPRLRAEGALRAIGFGPQAAAAV